MADTDFSEYLTGKNVGLACGAAAVLFFFLPWIGIGPFKVSGFSLALSGGEMAGSSWILWFIVRILEIGMLLLPIGGGLAAYAAYSDDKGMFNMGWIVAAGGMVISIIFLIFGSFSGINLFGMLGFGYFLSWAAVGGMFYSTKMAKK